MLSKEFEAELDKKPSIAFNRRCLLRGAAGAVASTAMTMTGGDMLYQKRLRWDQFEKEFPEPSDETTRDALDYKLMQTTADRLDDRGKHADALAIRDSSAYPELSPSYQRYAAMKAAREKAKLTLENQATIFEKYSGDKALAIAGIFGTIAAVRHMLIKRRVMREIKEKVRQKALENFQEIEQIIGTPSETTPTQKK